MGESYVRPVTSAREPRPAWLAVWRFRLVVLALIAAFAFASVWFFRQYIDPNRAQDPSFQEGLRAPVQVPR